MKVEVPEFKRCLCCIPLRYGLLFWGYVKLIASLIMMGLVISLTIITTNRIQRLTSDEYPIKRQMSYFIFEIVILVLLTLIVLLEISMNIVFIVGGYKKSLKLMKIFYYYNIVILSIFIFGFAVSITIDIIFEMSFIVRISEYYLMAVYNIKVKIGAGILYAVIQIYTILLIRSEVRKQQNHSTFHFNNIAAEAKCKMETDDGLEQQSNENLEDTTEVQINDDNVKINKVNLQKDAKLKLNKYKQIKNDVVE